MPTHARAHNAVEDSPALGARWSPSSSGRMVGQPYLTGLWVVCLLIRRRPSIQIVNELAAGSVELDSPTFWPELEIAASLLGLRNHMISLIPCAEASIVSPMGTPSRIRRTAACPFVSTQSTVTPFQHQVETAAMNVATFLRPVTGTPAARTSPPPSE